MTTIYQPHYFLTGDDYSKLKGLIAERGGLCEIEMFEKDDLFQEVGLTFQGIAYINVDNTVKPLHEYQTTAI